MGCVSGRRIFDERCRCTDLVQRNDLAVGLLDLAELAQEVPEAGLGDDIVGSEDAHPVKLGGRVGLTGEVTANDLVLLKTT